MDVVCRLEVSIDARRNRNPGAARRIRARGVAPLTHLSSVAAAITDQEMKDETD
jgi:hypothetical protein